jgi:catechol 2,3-dioxygenase-like lactoylglutathione lyase family enzyme
MFEIWGVRYQVKDVGRSIKFYTEHLGFKLVHQAGSMFASVSLSGLNVFLSGPGSSGCPASARWTSTGTGRLESGRPESC